MDGITENVTVTIRDEYIELYKLLKLANLADSGGQAKYMISEGMVRVNGEVDTRKRRKTRVGDMVEYDGERVTVASAREEE
ncbi:RNA-binding S4 domain-containing protein [Candidatus Electrothrix sp.]|uniref:RNA-binding S4 domain-containing protein n=2 Tax=Candidatus Electrothrix sp. TaxID=2170559 RepID=UPI004056F418